MTGSVASTDVSSTTRPSTRPTVARSRAVGIALGLAGLVALLVLAVALPRLDGAAATSGATAEGPAADGGTEVTLPAEVPGFALVEPGDEAGADQLRERLDSAEVVLEETYDVPVTVGLYSGEDGAQDQRSAVITAATAAPGLFLPSGPAPEPGLLGLVRAQAELVRVDGAVCNVVYGAPVPQGQEVDDTVPPSGVQCQLTAADGVTYQVDGSGVQPEEAAALLTAIADA